MGFPSTSHQHQHQHIFSIAGFARCGLSNARIVDLPHHRKSLIHAHDIAEAHIKFLFIQDIFQKLSGTQDSSKIHNDSVPDITTVKIQQSTQRHTPRTSRKKCPGRNSTPPSVFRFFSLSAQPQRRNTFAVFNTTYFFNSQMSLFSNTLCF